MITIPAARIAGRLVEGELHEVRRPHDGTLLATAGWAGPEAVDDVVAAAVAARDGWGSTSASDRAAALRGIAAALRADDGSLAAIIADESGKRPAEAAGEVEFSARYFDWFAEATTQESATHGPVTEARRFVVRSHPVGVVAALGTWNFPLSIPARKVASVLAAACPVVLKPSERTPVTADRFVALCEAHLPLGVIGSVVGDGAVLSHALIDHPDVAAVTFTGSTVIGRVIAQRCGASLTRAVLELGGRAPFIIRADADLDDAIEHLLVAKLRNNGESCIAANNVFVHTSLYERLWDRLEERLGATRPGGPADTDADFGPLIDAAAVDRLEGLVTDAAAAGARVVKGQLPPEHGSYMPAVLVDCSEPTALWDEEIFGPVLALRGYDDEDALVQEINGWGLGLAGYVCGTDLEGAETLAARLRIGIVGVNTGAPNTPEVPFGGFGASGLGREGGLSGMREFREEQTLSLVRQ